MTILDFRLNNLHLLWLFLFLSNAAPSRADSGIIGKDYILLVSVKKQNKAFTGELRLRTYSNSWDHYIMYQRVALMELLEPVQWRRESGQLTRFTIPTALRGEHYGLRLAPPASTSATSEEAIPWTPLEFKSRVITVDKYVGF